MRFIKLTVKCSSETSDMVAYALHEHGSMGEVFDDYGNIREVLEAKRWDYADASLFTPTDGCTVSGFFTLEADIADVTHKILQLKDLDFADFSDISVSTEYIDSEEWENEWKKYYKPFNLGNIVVIPEWIEYDPAPGDIPVYLNPGPAFGTGTHETTSMCVELMQRIDMSNARVLDFGCGSGILGICATKLGAKSVVYADFDEQAISATKHNCMLNGIHSPELVQCDVRDMEQPADVIIANITANVLIDVEPIIRAALKNGGYTIISGIISDYEQAVKDRYSEHFTLVAGESKNEWRAFIYKI